MSIPDALAAFAETPTTTLTIVEIKTDAIPSDFYLFGYVKQFLSGYQFADQDSLLEAVSDILVGIEKVILERVFHNWIEGLCQCSATGGEYMESRNVLH
jgi:hypothetical protein